MIANIYKSKRNRNGKSLVSRTWRARVRLPGETRVRAIALGVSDKLVAQQKLQEIIRESEREAVGIIPSKLMRDSAAKPLEKHLGDYLADLDALGRDEMYVYNLDRWITKLLAECGWQFAKDASADSFIQWRARNSGKAAKTLNQYHDALRGFFGWMMRTGRVAVNPMASVGKVEVRGKERRIRRAFTDDEMRRLLACCKPAHRPVYVVAVFTGLRRAELGVLRKGDLHLYCDNPYVLVRAATTKNHKDAVLWLHPDVVNELRKLVKQGDAPEVLVFKNIPSMERFRTDLKSAKIPFLDSLGRRADFHSLRYTLATNLHRAGVSPRVAMEFMRHSDLRLTNKTYTDATLLPQAEAVDKLPSLLKGASQIDSQNSVAGSPFVSRAVTAGKSSESKQSPVNIGESHGLAPAVMVSQKVEDGTPARTRT